MSACTSVDPTADYERARDEVTAATGETSLYQPETEADERERLEKLIEDGLTAQEAVQICLQNNRDIQALLFEIGLRRADAVQAGLLANPSLGAVLRFPVGGGQTNFEGSLLQNIVELWHIGPRERLAESQLEQSVLEVAHAASTLAAETKAAYYSATAAEAALAVANENLGTAREFFELTLERQEAGAATEVDANAARSELLEQEVLLRAAQFDAFESKRQLALLLGLALEPESLMLGEGLLASTEYDLDLDRLLRLAMEHRLDLRAARKSTEAAEYALELENRLFLRSVRGGVAFQSEDGETRIGPAFAFQIPIFDQNQAQVAKAEYRYSQAKRRTEAIKTQVVQEVRGAYQQYLLARDTARVYEERLLPLRQASLALAREAFAEGKTGFLSVLEVQKRLLAARRDFVSRLEAVARSLPALEAACGRPLAEVLRTEGHSQVPLGGDE